MNEIEDILMKQVRLVSEASRNAFEFGDAENLSKLTSAMCETVGVYLHVMNRGNKA